MKKITMVSFPLFAAALVASEWAAHAATYNFYFNNTEQGDNSTATPSVTVRDDGKVFKNGVPVENAKKDATPGTAKDEASAPVGSSSYVSTAVVPKENKDPHWRFSLGVSAFKDYGSDASYPSSNDPQLSASFSFFFNRYIGLTLFGSKLPGIAYSMDNYSDSNWMMGFEAEIVPFHISIGGAENALEIGFLGGFETRYSSQTVYSSNFYSMGGETMSTGDNWEFQPEAGIRVSVNLGHSWSIIGDVRATENYATGEAALAFKL